MSTAPTIFLFLIITPPLCLLTNSWIILWIILEINTISFCTIISFSQNNNNQSSDSAINYLIIQSVASAILLIYISSSDQGILINIIFYGGISALLINIASVPFHSWFISLTNNSSWGPALTLITWQNLIPLYLIIYLLSPLVSTSLMLSALLGSFSQINKNNTLEILALSSIFNLSWLLASTLINLSVIIVFIALYWTSLSIIVIIINSINFKYLNNETLSKHNQWSTMAIMASLAGLPPTIGFLANWILLTNILSNIMASVVTVLLITSAINLFIYLRISTNVLSNINNTNLSTPTPTQNNTTIWILAINIPSLTILIYG